MRCVRSRGIPKGTMIYGRVKIRDMYAFGEKGEMVSIVQNSQTSSVNAMERA